MGRKRLQKYQQFNTFDFTYSDLDVESLDAFQQVIKNRPLILELACGRAEYSLAMAPHYPNHLLIGVDRQSDRLLIAARQVASLNISNVLLLKSQVANLNSLIDEHSVEQIWIPFPDPFPKKKHHRRRLSHHHYLKVYQLLVNTGDVHLKTDSQELWTYSMQQLSTFPQARILESSSDLYQDDRFNPHTHPNLFISSYYQQQFLEQGLAICYLHWTYDSQAVVNRFGGSV